MIFAPRASRQAIASAHEAERQDVRTIRRLATRRSPRAPQRSFHIHVPHAYPALLAFAPIESYGSSLPRFPFKAWTVSWPISGERGKRVRRGLLIVGFTALAIGLLWIGQGTGVVAWPKSSFMINEIHWALYGAVLSGIGLILIWQSQR